MGGFIFGGGVIMVKVLLENIESKHELFELIRVFFPENEVEFVTDEEQSKSGYFLKISLLDNGLQATTKAYYNGDLIHSYKEEINSINIYREKSKTIKLGIKKSIYNCLRNMAKDNLSWGVLTGIRPTKLVHELLQQNIDNEEVFKILTGEYLLEGDKAKVLMNIANKQRQYIYPTDKDKYSLYISIPFCPTRCVYCSFPSLPIHKYNDMVELYIDKLIYEIDSIKELMKNKIINTVYIGGGTPTSILPTQLERIIHSVYNNFGVDYIKEFTVEAGRPDTINRQMLLMLKANSINRISINPQTMNDNTLKLMGRNHTSNDIVKAYQLAKEIGIENINMDLIVGLPGEGIKEMEYTLKCIEELNPENLTVHTLAVKRGSEFKDHIKEYEIDSQNIIEQMLQMTKDYADRMKMEPYYLYRQKQIMGNFENIGYTKANKECIYNISIMEEKETILAAGMGAVSKIYNPTEDTLIRVPNFKSLKDYIERIDELVERKSHYLYHQYP